MEARRGGRTSRLLLLPSLLLPWFIPPSLGAPPPDYANRASDVDPATFENYTSGGWRIGAAQRQRWDNEWDYADLAFKIDASSLGGPGMHLLNGVFLGHTIARETFVSALL